MKKNNNKGFSYVEMIVVIGIIAIVVGLIGLSVGLINRTNVAKAGDRAMSVLNEARVASLTKGADKGVCNFVIRNGQLYAYIGEPLANDQVNFSTQRWEKICSRAIEVGFADISGDKFTEGDVRWVKFSQSSGAPITPGHRLRFVNGDRMSVVVIDEFTGKISKQ